jgi:hypothetical protein
MKLKVYQPADKCRIQEQLDYLTDFDHEYVACIVYSIKSVS